MGTDGGIEIKNPWRPLASLAPWRFLTNSSGKLDLAQPRRRTSIQPTEIGSKANPMSTLPQGSLAAAAALAGVLAARYCRSGAPITSCFADVGAARHLGVGARVGTVLTSQIAWAVVAAFNVESNARVVGTAANGTTLVSWAIQSQRYAAIIRAARELAVHVGRACISRIGTTIVRRAINVANPLNAAGAWSKAGSGLLRHWRCVASSGPSRG